MGIAGRGPRPTVDAMDDATFAALRRAGWSVEQIVAETGARPGAVAAGLGAHGPGPQSWTVRTLARAVTWAELRAAGQRVVDIAAREGVSHQQVSSLTRPFGPFPAPPDPVEAWVSARRAGRRIHDIAREYCVSTHRVSAVTKPHGPFPYPRREPPDRLTTPAIARWTGVAVPTVQRWQAKADFPPPLAQAEQRTPVWDRSAVQAWVKQHLTACPVCGAQVLNLPRHRGARRH